MLTKDVRFNMKTTDLKNYLILKTVPDLAKLYNYNMEVQVNVLQAGGEPVVNEYKGKIWRGFTNGDYTWKSFRIPFDANTEPHYEDTELKWPLDVYAEGIGMTGWDWNNKQSVWVAFDFDSIVSHKQSGLTSEELDRVQNLACEVDWVTVRKSTSGNGIHLYVFFADAVSTKNHTEHSALARYVLSILSARTGFNFANKVDICGGNMWVWHRKMAGTDGLSLIKQGVKFTDVSEEWRDHVEVCKGRRKQALPQAMIDQNDSDDSENIYAELTGQYVKEQLDSEHKKLMDYFNNNGCFWYWNQDGNMLITHTSHLKQAHEALNLKGYFNTTSTGANFGNDHNCFLFPIRRGGWVVRRFTIGCAEHDSWDTDGSGWTRCYLNVNPDLKTLASAFGGNEDSDNGFVFTQAERAEQVLTKLGVNIQFPVWSRHRKTKVKEHKDGSKLVIEVAKEGTDNPNDMEKWIDNSKTWKRVVRVASQTTTVVESKNYDDILRHNVTEQRQDAGWVIKSDGDWTEEPLGHIKMALKSMGHSAKVVEEIMGESIFRKWTLVNKPFQEEYPGDRQWNKDACQLKHFPSKSENLSYPTWSKILSHVGAGLDDPIRDDPWCRQNGILSGGDYLKCWIASLFQFPEKPLPYLFLYGPEKSGKSIFHEVISELITGKGYQRADTALLSASGFNNELRHAVLCVIEETNLSTKNRIAYNRIKDWVTSPVFQIHPKGGDPYMITNTMHFIQCSNFRDYCYVAAGDTRVTLIYVIPPVTLEDKYDLIERCKKEASDFLGAIFSMDLPKSQDKRLNLPIIETSEKQELQKANQNPLETFLDEKCFYTPGEIIEFSEFHDEFSRWLDPSELSYWTKIRTGKSMPDTYPKGRRLSDNHLCLGNIAWEQIDSTKIPLIVKNNKLIPKGS